MYSNSFPPSTLNDLLERSRQIKDLHQKVPYRLLLNPFQRFYCPTITTIRALWTTAGLGLINNHIGSSIHLHWMKIPIDPIRSPKSLFGSLRSQWPGMIPSLDGYFIPGQRRESFWFTVFPMARHDTQTEWLLYTQSEKRLVCA